MLFVSEYISFIIKLSSSTKHKKDYKTIEGLNVIYFDIDFLDLFQLISGALYFK